MPTSNNVPELFVLVEAARDIVITARKLGTLGSLTVKTVRKQVEQKFSLDEGALDDGSTKSALRSAVNMALYEDLEVNTAEKRKRSPQDSVEREEVKAKKKIKKIKKLDPNQRSEEKRNRNNEKKRKGSAKSKEIIVTESEDGETAAPASTSKAQEDISEAPTQSAKGPGKTGSEKGGSPDAQSVNVEKSESELSVLIDDPPRRRRTKGKAKHEGAKKSATRKRKKEEDTENPLSPDEERIKRLKSLVSACGVRKPWSKEFVDLPLPEQQIARLKEILADLGMTGKYSLEKARAIKEKRALARELDDVVEFERKAGVSRSERGRRKSNARRIVAELDTDSEISESEYQDEDSSGGKGKTTASKSIMAYLANQSSDED